MSDEDEAAEMEDEAVRSRVQHTPKVRGEAVGGGHPWALPHPHPPSPGGVVALSEFSVAATQTLCALSVSVSLSVSGFLALSVPTAPTSDSNPGLPVAPRRTSSG